MLPLPIEDSQDLYNSPPVSQTRAIPRNLQENTQDDFHFALEDDTQSQFLDADG